MKNINFPVRDDWTREPMEPPDTSHVSPYELEWLYDKYFPADDYKTRYRRIKEATA